MSPEKLSLNIRQSLAKHDVELWLSSASLWEFLLLVEKDRIELFMDPQRWIDDALLSLPTREAPLTHDIARLSHGLLPDHKDPADRFLAATAKTHDLTLLTADGVLLAAKGFKTMSAV